jgi:predicted RNase H-like HicB family nuclease
MYHYTYKVFWSEDDGEFVAIIPDIPELAGVSAFGDTPEAALADMAVVLDLLTESYEADGRALPEPSTLTPA